MHVQDCPSSGQLLATLYFHIDVLGKSDDPLLTQTKNKRYILIAAGRSAFEMIQKGSNHLLVEAELNMDTRHPKFMTNGHTSHGNIQTLMWFRVHLATLKTVLQ